MNFTKEMVDKYAKDLLIGLTDEENKMVLEEFQMIDKNIDIINTIEGLDKVDAMTHTLDEFEYTLRYDEVSEINEPCDILKNAGMTDIDTIIVPKVVE